MHKFIDSNSEQIIKKDKLMSNNKENVKYISKDEYTFDNSNKKYISFPTKEEILLWVIDDSYKINVTYGKICGEYTYKELIKLLNIEDSSSFYLSLLKNNLSVNYTVAEYLAEKRYESDIMNLFKYFTTDCSASFDIKELTEMLPKVTHEKRKLLKSLNACVKNDNINEEENLYHLSPLNLYTLLTISPDVSEENKPYSKDFVASIFINGDTYEGLKDTFKKKFDIKTEQNFNDCDLLLNTHELEKLIDFIENHTIDKKINELLFTKIMKELENQKIIRNDNENLKFKK